MASGKLSIIATTAAKYGMETAAFEKTLRATVVPEKCSPEQFAAFILVAHEYDLNPLTKEIFCFPKQGGGIIPVVSVDGWSNLINSHPQMDGLEFDDNFDEEKKLVSITCRIFRKDRSKSTPVTEYMEECMKPTDVWRKWPKRMLRHKALIQCARYAFGFAGIYDADEAERIANEPETMIDVTPSRRPPPPEEEAVEQSKVSPLPPEAEIEIIDPDAILKAIDGHLAAAMDEGALEAIWNSTCKELFSKLTFPSDKIETEALYEKHEKRVTK